MPERSGLPNRFKQMSDFYAEQMLAAEYDRQEAALASADELPARAWLVTTETYSDWAETLEELNEWVQEAISQGQRLEICCSTPF